jgi:molybdenum cofactor synthesis domain-containing protein
MTNTAALVLIGTELVRGALTDDNRAFLSSELGSVGVSIASVHMIRDEAGAIADLVRYLADKVTAVITVGGLGPTPDDVTLEAVARAFGLALESRHPDDTAAYARMSGAETTQPLLRHFPVGSELIPTDHGPIVRTSNVYCLPGLPRLVRARLPVLLRRLGAAGAIHFRSISLNMPQSRAAPTLERASRQFPAIFIGCYPSANFVDGIALAFEGPDMEEIDRCVSFIETALGVT